LLLVSDNNTVLIASRRKDLFSILTRYPIEITIVIEIERHFQKNSIISKQYAIFFDFDFDFDHDFDFDFDKNIFALKVPRFRA
jgi:hypothetical protein